MSSDIAFPNQMMYIIVPSRRAGRGVWGWDSFNVSSTDSKEPRFHSSPRWRQPAVRQAGRGLKTLIFRAQLTILKPLSVSERGWGEVHRTHVLLPHKGREPL
jgi:hypothetical protein